MTYFLLKCYTFACPNGKRTAEFDCTFFDHAWQCKRHIPLRFRSDASKPNGLHCPQCSVDGIEHEIIDEPAGFTSESSCWGAGVPVTRHKCTGCGFVEPNRWVSSDIVGGGW